MVGCHNNYRKRAPKNSKYKSTLNIASWINWKGDCNLHLNSAFFLTLIRSSPLTFEVYHHWADCPHHPSLLSPVSSCCSPEDTRAGQRQRPHFSLPVLHASRTTEADLPQLSVCCWWWSLLCTSPLHPAVSHQNTVPWFSLLFCFWVQCFAFSQIVQSLMPHAYFLQKWLSPGGWSRAVSQLGLEARAQRKAFSPTVPFSIPLYLVPVSSISPLTLSIKPCL